MELSQGGGEGRDQISIWQITHSIIYFFSIGECGMWIAEFEPKNHKSEIEYSEIRNSQSEI
jgi:hypothetical protein